MRRTASDTAVAELRRQILGRHLAPGAMLPAERELSEHLGVSRLTLRSALAALQAEGLIEKVHGSGNRVLDFRQTGGIELMEHLAEHALSEGHVPLALLRDLLELRRLIAVEVLALVTARATAEQLDVIVDCRRRLDGLVDDAEAFMAADLAFAHAVVCAAGNVALELLGNTVQRMLRRNRGYEAAFGVNSRLTLATYDKLLELIATRDPEAVRHQAARLLTRLDRLTLDRLTRLQQMMEPKS